MILALSFVFGYSQTKPGFTVSAGIGTNNVSRNVQMGTLNGEVGAFSKYIGLTGAYYTVMDKNLSKASGYGLKAYVKLAQIDALSIWSAAEADLYIKEIDKNVRGKFSYKPELSVSVPLAKSVDASFGVHEFIYQQVQKGEEGTRYKTGATFKLVFRPFSK